MNSITGYKISKSHFKLGSKAHIRDFIYAKRLFQNSFFAHRFSFIVAKYLKDYFIKNPLKEGESLTLLGYGEYSQMLINRVERMLQPTIKNINHDMVRDVEHPDLIKGEKLNDNVIIIVPISTTFSTSIKVENMVEKMIKEGICNSKILQPYLNLILVSHNDVSDSEYAENLNTYLKQEGDFIADNKFHPYKLFNWTDVDATNKIVTIKTNPNSDTSKKQKFFISIPSVWDLPETCQFCIPKDNILKEKPLLETDKASVTPDLLLELPQSFKNNTYSANKEIVINEDSILSGHIEYLGNHYLHYIKPVEFYKKNEEEIIKWAKERKNDLKKWENLYQSKVLLISPSQQSNTYFVELINRYVFEDSATIIHYEILGDFVENYQKFFGEEVNSSVYTFYIDDFIQSGKTFHLINDFVKLCKKLSDNSSSPDGCNGVFTLINKTDNFSYTDILAHLNKPSVENISDYKRYFAFYDVKIHAINKDNCPLCNEQKRYKQLAESSMLDTIRHYFLNKQVKLNTQKITEVEKLYSDWYKYHPLVDETKEVPWNGSHQFSIAKWHTYLANNFPDKKYLKLLIKHELNYLLSTDVKLRDKLNQDISEIDIPENYKANEELFEDLKNKLFASKSISKITSTLNPITGIIFKGICEQLIIKVFTLHPFVNVKALRQKAFSWVLMELEKTMTKIISSPRMNFKDFRYLKFLLRRATLMGSNYLIRSETLNNLREIFKKYPPEKKKEVEDLRSRRILDFQGQLALMQKEVERINENDSSIDLKISYYENILKKGKLLPFSDGSKLNKLKIEKLDLKASLLVANAKISYIRQALNNISYKEASLSEFSYFYVALIKELTLNNDSKVLILEENLLDIKLNIDKEKESDFFFLVRLLQFENVTLIHQGFKIIVNDYFSQLKQSETNSENLICFSRKCSEKELEVKMKDAVKLALNDYRLSSFKIFLGIKDFESWSQSTDFPVYIHVLYLISALQKEEIKPCNISLEEKTKAIIQNIYRIVAYPNFAPERDDYKTDIKTGKEIRDYKLDDIGLGGFLAIRYKGDKIEKTKPEEIIIAQATSEHTKPTGPSLMKVEIDNESLSYFLLNGISSRNSTVANELINSKESNIFDEYPLKPWTILELQLKESEIEKYWLSTRGKVFPVNPELEFSFDDILFNKKEGKIKYGFTENLNIKGEPRQMLFFRIADIFQDNGKIKNIGQALVCLFNEEKGFDIKRVRLLLLIRTYLLSFTKTHFDSDSLTAFVNEKIKLKEAEKLKHGYQYYLDGLYSLAKGDENFIDEQTEKSDISKLYFDLVKSGPLLYTFFSDLEYRKAKGEIFDTKIWEDNFMPLVRFTSKSLLEKFEKMNRMILGTSNISNYPPIEIDNPQKFQFHKSIEDTNDLVVCFPETLIDIIFAEILINVKKNFPNDLAELFFELKSTDSNSFEITFLNNFDEKKGLKHKGLLRVDKNNVKYNTNGLGLIKRITGLLSDRYAVVKQGKNNKYGRELFQVSITIKNLLNE